MVARTETVDQGRYTGGSPLEQRINEAQARNRRIRRKDKSYTIG